MLVASPGIRLDPDRRHPMTVTQAVPRRHRARIILGSVLALLVAIQFIPYGRAHANPPVIAEPAWNAPETRALFMRACADCHSNETRWPWYTAVAPASWLIAHDVAEGREQLNVSEWGRGDQEADDAAEVVRDGSMPPWFYLPLHAEAVLTVAERQALIAGLTATFGTEDGAGRLRDGDDD
jgi:mono/diheme cytochrome c family protein